MTDDKKVSRRKFLRIAGGVLGAGVAAAGGVGYFGMKSPANVVFPYVTCPSTSGKKLLAAYSTRSGATGEISARITTALCNAGFTVDLRHMPDVEDISQYDGVVIGSPVYMGRVMGSCVSFIEKHLDVLRGTPSAFFGVGLTMKEETAENRAKMDQYCAPAIEALQPDYINYFGGRIDLDTLPFLFRLFAQAEEEGILAEGDFRNWDAVDLWSAWLSETLA